MGLEGENNNTIQKQRPCSQTNYLQVHLLLQAFGLHPFFLLHCTHIPGSCYNGLLHSVDLVCHLSVSLHDEVAPVCSFLMPCSVYKAYPGIQNLEPHWKNTCATKWTMWMGKWKMDTMCSPHQQRPSLTVGTCGQSGLSIHLLCIAWWMKERTIRSSMVCVCVV